MKIHLGNMTIHIDIENPSNPELLELKLGELLRSSLSISSVDKDISEKDKEKFTRKTTKFSMPPAHDKQNDDYTDEIEALSSADITGKTIISVCKKIFNEHRINQDQLSLKFGQVEKYAEDFLTRNLSDEDVWALYAAPVELLGEPLKIGLVGLNKQNHLTVLGLEDGTPVTAFKSLVQRGLNAKNIKLGILSFELAGTDAFKEVFKKSLVQLDWKEYIQSSKGAEQKILQQAMYNDKGKAVAKVLIEIEAPRELLTYLDFPQDLHRVIKTVNPVQKIQKEVNAKLKTRGLAKEHYQLIRNWEILRIQFQWSRLPTNNPYIDSLKFVKNKPNISID